VSTPLRPPSAPRLSRRPAGWLAPGPRPVGAQGDATLEPGPNEDLSFLTGDFRLFQLKRGHRWSVDDFLTAYFAGRHSSKQVQYALDLGCGVGSVLQMVAWLFPNAQMRGIEAQRVSFDLAMRSIRYNGLTSRTNLEHGDLRELSANLAAASFDLITGTPPYFPATQGTVSQKPQKEPCLFETRGGLEEYCHAAAPLLAPDGAFWVCAGPYPEQRGPRAAAAAGLVITRWVDVEPRRGKPILFRVFEMRRLHDQINASDVLREQFTVREADGTLTPAMHEARQFMGLPPSQERRAYADGAVPAYVPADPPDSR
jgi:tRNA1Val (adenine37-N6)-methyltransferase